MTGICKLCQLQKELRQSHIIPEFMYQNIYDANPKRFFTIKLDVNDPVTSSKRIEQKGIREPLLCDACEKKLAKYEGYAAETIYGKNRGNRAYIRQASETQDEQYFLYQYAGFDYENFKLFMMSILWRVLVSKTYQVAGVSSTLLETLRVAIFNEDPLEYDDFGCTLQTLLYKKGERAGGFILSPFLSKNNGHEVISVLIDGMMYSFYLNSKDVPNDRRETFLNKNGEMQIIGRVLSKDPGLKGVLSKAYDYFRKNIASKSL